MDAAGGMGRGSVCLLGCFMLRETAPDPVGGQQPQAAPVPPDPCTQGFGLLAWWTRNPEGAS